MQDSSSFEQQCTRIKDHSIPFLKDSFDAIVNELNKHQGSSNVPMIQQVLGAITSRSSHGRFLLNSHLLVHPLFILFRDCYLTLLHRWRTGQGLDYHSQEAFFQLGSLFVDLCEYANDSSDASILAQLLIDPLFITELRTSLNEIIGDGKHLHDERIKGLSCALLALHYLEKGRMELQSRPLMIELLESIVQCVCSPWCLQLFIQINELEKLNESQTFLLDVCTKFISSHDAGRYNDTTISVRTALLSPFVNWFEKYVSAFRTLTPLPIAIIGQLCITLIGGNAKDADVFPSNIRDDYCKMIDQIVTILNSIIDTPPIDESSMALTKVLTQNLYSLTMTTDLRSYIKSKHIVPLLLKVTNIDDDTIQFHVYRILASILTEEDIKTLINPSKTANVFLRFLTNLIDDSSMIPRFHNLLRSLKSKFWRFDLFGGEFFVSLVLIQHDQIKEELTKQDVLPLLLRCATESKFDPIHVRLAALEIVLALTFNTEAARRLKENASFITHLKTLTSSSTEQRLQRVAESLLWKLEKEETAMAQSEAVTTKKYHIMLSYSHSDRELCYRIHDWLVKDQFRVWIDRDQMHGQTMVAMANAIENSEFVFICMSETYKQSAYCQSEAHYAFERRCHLLPVIMKSSYRPDGWLGILASGKIYVDFPKLGFEVAYEKVKNEIARYRGTPTSSNPLVNALQHDLPPAVVTRPVLANNDYPSCLDHWTSDHVQAFLINENLDSLLPVLGKMNGHLLHETHKRCKAHWDLMFQAFKSEVAASDSPQKLLTIDTYIRFLDAIEKYLPINTSRENASSLICLLM